ncbi:3-deoxy-D-manno-octulosonic acid transferase [Chthonobacter albigriseus]|uniref:3-deoxy-D-manno-octulosonic acid transferase n=1 Tax=Chthonobacter albigriseus TaxID=1683161 RepID=UPI0015EED132|nr:3-deoxy-D-manno-octulosonic acid transferase [Chthonobacter albigriseus]
MADSGDRLLAAYVSVTRVASPIGRLIVGLRRRFGKEHADRWRERLGVADRAGTGGPTVWVHAASVGETVAILPLVERLAASGLGVVLTTVTVTSAGVVERKALRGVVHQFVPLDFAPYIDRFLDTWHPGLALFVESEIWPAAVARLADRGVPLAILNGRMSDRSYRGWSRFSGVAAAIFGRVALCLAQSDADADRFRRLGVRDVRAVGNIKFDAPVPEAARPVHAALKAAIGDRPVLLAASTHEGEEEQVLDAYARLAPGVPGLLLVIAPRHPARGAAVMAMATGRGLEACQRSAGALPGRTTAVYVADTVGELGTFYRLASVAFVGGSLVGQGGHNPIEPARLGVAVVTGPQVDNFRDIYATMLADGAVTMVPDAAGLAEAAERLIHHRHAREAQVAAASALVERLSGALDRSFEALQPLIAAVAAGGRP